jgi:hypothetical protein
MHACEMYRQLAVIETSVETDGEWTVEWPSPLRLSLSRWMRLSACRLCYCQYAASGQAAAALDRALAISCNNLPIPMFTCPGERTNEHAHHCHRQ